MIELAPNHKIGLSLPGPVMIASGFCGYGDAYQRLLNPDYLGAVVTQPITLRPQRGKPQPRLAEIQGGFILDTGQQNPGVKKVLKQYGKVWQRLSTPVIAHLPAAEANDLMRTARAVGSIQSTQGDPAVAAIELGIPSEATPHDVEHWVRAIQEGCELPLLVKLPLNAPPDIADAAANAFADALVIGTGPLGAATLPDLAGTVGGVLYGPAIHSLVLHRLQLVSEFELPLVAAGGIHSVTQARAFFEAGAAAIQLDSILFIDPHLANRIAQAFHKMIKQ